MNRTIFYGSMLMLLYGVASHPVCGSNLMCEEPKKMKHFFVTTRHADDQESTLYYQLRDKRAPIVSSKNLKEQEKKKSQGVQHTPAPHYEPMDDSDWENFNSLLSFSSAELDACSRQLENMDLDEDSPFDPID